MRACLIGAPTPHLLRVQRVLLEQGWQVDLRAFDSRRLGRYEIVIIEEAAPAPMLRSRIDELRRCYDHEVILVLGDFPPAARCQALSLGADDVIASDVPGALLMGRVRALLRLRPQAVEEYYRVDELEVDLSRRHVRRGGQDILLSHREFQLLVLLVQQAGQVIPRSAVIERLWAGDLTVNDNAVDALVSRLRRRIDGPYTVKLLRTVRGVGFQLCIAEELRLAS